MRLLFSIVAAMLVAQSANAQSLWRNFFTTNQNPIVEVVAGSNATVQASTVGVNLRRFTVNSVPSSSGFASNVFGTNVIGAVLEATHATNADFATYATNAGTAASGWPTNWPLASITNANHLTNWATVDTNVLGTLVQTNISLSAVTNAQNLTNWALIPTNYVPDNSSTSVYASLLTSTAIGLADTNWVLQQIAAIGEHIFSVGVTNTGALDGKTNNWQGWSTPVSTVTTNSIVSPTTGSYIRQVVSTNTYVRVETGPISVSAYLFRSGAAGGTMSLHPEIYLFDTVSNTLFVELIAGAPQTVTATAPTLHEWSVLTASFTHTNPCKIVLSWKMDGTPAVGAILNFVAGGSYDSHVTFIQNLASATISATQISGVLSPTQIATNTPSANQVLTATSPGSAAWQNRVVRTVGITVDGGGSAITTGVKGFLEVPYACTITAATMLADQNGGCGINVWRTNSIGFPPTAVGKISGAATPVLTATNWSRDTTLTGWTTSLAAGDILGFNVESNATITRVTLQLKVQP